MSPPKYHRLDPGQRRDQIYIGLLERLGAQREEDLRPPVGRSARARVADSVSRWLDWTEANRTIWLAAISHGATPTSGAWRSRGECLGDVGVKTSASARPAATSPLR